MKIDKPQNSNYCGTVVEIKNIVPLPNCDNVVSTTFFGFQAIISKDHKVGDIGIVFPAECQLSDEYCYNNNLYRHGDKNSDESVKGYIEDNRRIKAVKFRNNPSTCLFMPLESLKYTRIDLSILSVGDEFDTLNGKEICKKYTVARNVAKRYEGVASKIFKRVDPMHMPEHLDSSNYFKWGNQIDDNKTVIITQKLHGTSIRVGHTITKRKLNYFEFILKKFGVNIQPTNYDYVYGSRKVIKDVNNPYQNHFYGSDIWTKEGERLKGLIPENYLVYGELIGWTGEEAIQKNYTYSVEKGKAELYVYRIAIVNNQGFIVDLSWDQLKEFCIKNGLKHVPEIWVGKKSEFNADNFMNKRFFEDGYKNCLYLGDNKDLVDEGVCVRVDGLVPTIFKAKCSKFLEHETKLLDKGEEDLESSQTNA